MLNEACQDKRRADRERGKLSGRLAKVMGRWTGKRWSRALQHARGQSNKRGAVKNQYLLINFPTLLACKKPAEQCLYWHSSPPSLYLSFQTQGPNRQRCNQSGKLDGGQTGEKGTGIGSHVGLGQKKQLNGCHFLRKGISEGGLWFYVMNFSLLGSHRGDGGGESKAARCRLPRQLEKKQERKKNDSAACCFSPGPISITPLMSLLKICQRSVSALVPNVCICDCMHAECVYSCQLQTCLSYFSDEVMFLEKIQVTTRTECQNNFSFQFSPQLYQKQGYHLLFLLVDCFRFV